MRKTLIMAISLLLGLGCLQTTEAQKLGNLKKKASKSVQDVTKTTSSLPKTSSKKAPSKVPRTRNTTPTHTSPRQSSSRPSSRATNSRASSTASTQPSHIDTTNSRNYFWKEDIAQQLLKATGEERYKSSLKWNKAKVFTDSYSEIKNIIDENNRPKVSADLVETIDVLITNLNYLMDGAESSTNFQQETEKTINDWKKVVEGWRDSPATHFNYEGVTFQASADYLNSVEIDEASFENYFDVKFDVKGFNEPKIIRFSTFMNIDQTTYGEITALDNGYFVVDVNGYNRIVFGKDASKAKEIEATLAPLFPENPRENCTICNEVTGTNGKIFLTTKEEPSELKGLDFYESESPWNGVDPIYATFVLPQSLDNIISKTNPWVGGSVKIRWYIKGEKDKAQTSWEATKIGQVEDRFFFHKLYNGVGNEELTTADYEYLHYALMHKGPGNYTLVTELYLKEGDDESGWTDTTVAIGETKVNLTEANYKQLFVGPKKKVGTFCPPKYTGSASSSVIAAVKKDDPSVKAVYNSSNKGWYWVQHQITGENIYQLKDDVIAITNKDEKNNSGSYHINLSLKKKNGVITVVGGGSHYQTSKRNFNIR